MRCLADGPFSGITTIQSGTPLTFLMGDDVALDGTFGDQHAQLRPGVTTRDIVVDHADRGSMIDSFSRTAALRTNDVPRGTYGNAGRGGPALNATDLALMEDFPFSSERRVCTRGEAFNAFNQVNFGNPVTAVSWSLWPNTQCRRPTNHAGCLETPLVMLFAVLFAALSAVASPPDQVEALLPGGTNGAGRPRNHEAAA